MNYERKLNIGLSCINLVSAVFVVWYTKEIVLNGAYCRNPTYWLCVANMLVITGYFITIAIKGRKRKNGQIAECQVEEAGESTENKQDS